MWTCFHALCMYDLSRILSSYYILVRDLVDSIYCIVSKWICMQSLLRNLGLNGFVWIHEIYDIENKAYYYHERLDSIEKFRP